MAFYDLVDQVIARLQQRGRLSYRALAQQFELDDARLDALKFELIEVQGVAADQDGAVLVWTGTAQPMPPEVPSATAPGHHRLKGVTAPVPVHRVQRERESRDPAGETGVGRLTPLVGREREVAVLLDRWEQSKEGHGQMVLLSGEAGIGKSRLVQELKARIAGEPHIQLEGRGSPYHQQSAFHPLIDLLLRLLRFDRGDSAEAKLEKLTQALRQYRLPVEALLPFLASLLGLPIEPARDPFHVLSPQRYRQQTLEALLTLVLQLAAQQAVLMIVEDLHWADPSTLEVLALLLEQAPTARLLLVLTARPDFRVPWRSRASLTWLTLTRLRRAQVERMVAAITGGRVLPSEVVEQVASKTDGVPLFVEELTKMVLESNLVREEAAGYELAGPLPPLAIPTTLQDSLMARLDRLATTEVVAQLGATLGRSFSYELLQAVAGLDEATLALELGTLVEAELLYQRGLPPDATYSFKHALIQDAAYQRLLPSTRQQYHQRVAQALETQFADIVQAQPEILAYHYTKAGLGGQAIPYWQRAGQRAIERFANVEAIAHLTRGLELLETLPDTPMRVQRELQLLTALGPALILAKGQGAPDVERAYTRARELCRHVGETPQLFPVLWGLWHFHLARAEYPTARELGEQLLGIAERAHDPALLLLAHRALGPIGYFQGELASSRAHLEQAITLYDPRQHRSLVFQYAQDPGVACRSFSASVLWLLGYPDQALKMAREAVTLARELAHPFSGAIALSGVVGAHQYRREIQEVQKQIEEQSALITEHGLTYLLAPVTIMRGWALAELGRGEEGIAQMCAGIAAMQARKAEIFRPYWLTLLAESYGKVGQVSEGLRIVGDALAATRKTGERFWEAESYRIKGELLLRQSTERDSAGSASRKTALVAEPSVLSAAAECFHQAVDVAQRQQAKSLELRATVSLCRLWQGQGRTEEASLRLAEVYEWFTEGFDTRDLEEAKALLSALA